MTKTRAAFARGLPEPFFYACGINLPHVPWFVPAEYMEMFAPDRIALPAVLEGDDQDLPVLGRKTFNRMKGPDRALKDQKLVRQAVDVQQGDVLGISKRSKPGFQFDTRKTNFAKLKAARP